MSKTLETRAATVDSSARNHSYLTTQILRGGRMTKLHGEAASYSPQLGLVASSDASSARPASLAWSPSARLRALLRMTAATLAIAAGSTQAFAQDVVNSPDGINVVTAGTPIVISSYDSITGLAGDGLDLTSAGGAITVARNGPITGIGGSGIVANAEGGVGGDIIINENGNISGTDFGIYAKTNGSGSIEINTVGGAIEAGLDGIQAQNRGKGDLNIVTGDIMATGQNGIYAFNNGASLTIDTTAGDVTGYQSAVYGFNDGGPLSIRTANVTSQTDTAIRAYNSFAGAELTIDTTAGTVTGETYGMKIFDAGNGALVFNTGNVIGKTADGINIVAESSVTGVEVDTSGGTVEGGATGIHVVDGGQGSLAITTGAVKGTQQDGIFAQLYGAGENVFIETLGGKVSGGDYGIRALSDGTGELRITTADVTGENLVGISAQLGSAGTNTYIDTRGGTVIGGTTGIEAIHDGSGSLTIVTSAVSGLTEDGIFASSSVGDGVTIDSTGGKVEGYANGIRVENYGTGATVITTADVTAIEWDAIDLVTSETAGEVVVDTTAGKLEVDVAAISGHGIDIFHRGSGDVTVKTADITASSTAVKVGTSGSTKLSEDMLIDTTAGTLVAKVGIEAFHGGTGTTTIRSADIVAAQTGIYVERSGSSDVVIDTTAGTLTAGVRGIAVGNGFNGVSSSGSLKITTADIVGEGAFGGIFADFDGTYALIDTTAGSIAVDGDAIDVDFSGTGDLTIVTGDVTSRYDDGITANMDNSDASGDLIIDTRAGTISGDSDGIYARHSTLGMLKITTADVIGKTNFGIAGYTEGSGLIIDSSMGSVTGEDYGILAENYGTGDLVITTGDVKATLGKGIFATNYVDAAALKIDTTAGSVVANYAGIEVLQEAQGLASVITGDVTSEHLNGIVIKVTETGGDALLDTSAGHVQGAMNGIVIDDKAMMATLDIVTGDVTGAFDALVIDTAGAIAKWKNLGTISAGDYAMRIVDGASTQSLIDNQGTINGKMLLGAYDDQMLNKGTFNAAGITDFGGGSDTLINSGLLAVTGSASLNGLEELTSSGTVRLRDGVGGTTLALSGDFVGTGGTLEMDVDFDGPSDLLTVGGAALGKTTLVVNDISGSLSLGGQKLVVDGGSDTSANAFTLGPVAQATAFTTYSLLFDAAANDFLLTRDVSGNLFEAGAFLGGAQSLWYRTADAWAARKAAAGTLDRPAAWMQVHGSSGRRDETVSFVAADATQTLSLDRKLTTKGVQVGVDIPLANANSVIGLTGGLMKSDLDLDHRTSSVGFKSVNLGASFSTRSGPLMLDALVKADWINGKLNDSVPGGFDGDFDGTSVGVRGQVAYRFGSETFHVQPQASIEYVHNNLDPLELADGRFDFDDADGARAMVGVGIGGGTGLKYDLAASYVKQLSAGSHVNFRSGEDRYRYQVDGAPDHARVEGGLNWAGTGRVSAFARARADVGKDYRDYSANAGIGVKF